MNERDFLETAGKHLKREIDADDHNRQAAVDDLKFVNGDQWDPAEEMRRRLRGRPCLKLPELRKYINQVVGDMRQNRARVKVRPVDSAGDVEIAKIRSGLIANIEYLSNAEAIYDYAGEMAASCGYGAWRILTRYCEDNPFLQEVYLERIRNPFLVYMDSAAKSEVYADAKYGFVLEKVTREEFEDRFPGKEAPTEPLKTGKGIGQEVWFAENAFFIADYYCLEKEKKTVCLMADGQIRDKEEYEARLAEWQEAEEAKIALRVPAAGAQPGAGPLPPMQAPPPLGSQVSGTLTPPAGAPAPTPPPLPEPPDELTLVQEREIEVPRVRYYAITANQILEGPKDIPGQFIPIVLLRGPEMNIEGKTHIRSLIRDAKDPQRLLNFWVTDAAEIVDMIPKAPWIGTARQFEGYEQDYAAANAENFPFLKYNVDAGAPPPSRVGISGVPVAVFEQIGQAKQAIKDAVGMFNADVGDKGPELSGRAILQRQKPGDVGTFQFIDNLTRSIAHSGRIVNEMIPEVYDTERDVRIKNADDTETFAPVNTTVDATLKTIQAEPQKYQGIQAQKLAEIAAKKGRQAKYNDLTAGKYDVVVTTGPAFATQRQESAQVLERLVQAYPQIMTIAGDLVYRFQDFLGAEEIAERIERTMPPHLVPPKEGAPPRPPAPPPPQMQIKLAEVEVKKMHLEVERQKLQVQKLKAMNEVVQSKGETKKMLLDLLQEVFAPAGGFAGGVQGSGGINVR
jgi:hypothetical protein